MINAKDEKATLLGTIEGFQIKSHNSIESLKADWELLQQASDVNIYQSYEWTRLALETIEYDSNPIIVTGENSDGMQFILPLTVEQRRFYQIIRWIGKSHAAVCSGLYSQSFLKAADDSFMRALIKLIGNHVDGIKILSLKNQPPTIGDFTNPMASLPKQPSVNSYFDMELPSTIDIVLARGNAKRKRKIFRRQLRIAEEMGGFELFIPTTEADIDAAIEDFLTQKAKRFKEMGIGNVFENQETAAFLKALAHAPLKEGTQPLRIFELKVGGKTRAMYGCGIYGKNCQSLINSVTFDEFSDESPGEMIIYLMIEHLIDAGFEMFDFGVGLERYKTSWCGEPKALFDTLMPLSKSAAPIFTIQSFLLKSKKTLRSNPKIWPYIKKLRKRLIGTRS